MKSKTFGLLTMCLLCSIPIGSLWREDTLYSSKENRLYAQIPQFSLSSLFDATFMKDSELYVEDQIVLRNTFLDIKFLSERIQGKTRYNDIYLGSDEYMMKIDKYDIDIINQNLSMIQNFINRYEATLYLLPTSAYLLEDYLPSYVEDNVQKDAFQKLREKAWINPMDDVLRAHLDEALYYRSDHHISAYGMKYIYEEWCKEKQREPRNIEFETISSNFLGSYARESNNIFSKKDELDIVADSDAYIETVLYDDIIEKTSLYEKKYLGKQDEYATLLDGNHGITKISTNAKTGKSLVMFKDSYGNSFAPFLVSDYDSITLIDLSLYRGNLEEILEEENIDILFFYSLSSLQAKGFEKLLF